MLYSSLESCMDVAISEAKAAYSEGEVPVGAAIFDGSGTLVAKSHNTGKKQANPLMHAEMRALHEVFASHGAGKLADMSIFATLEPCPMCMGAIIQAGLGTLCYGAPDFAYGAAGGFFSLQSHPSAKKLAVYAGIKEEECSKLLSGFFAEIRKAGQ
ncbi:MAG: nucleoside deaminase [Eubacteriaceae bacterium]|nr:nucleoside deaminase [Eubacteriaceae bacterium]